MPYSLNNIAIMNNIIMRNKAELQLQRANLINLNMHDTFKLNEKTTIKGWGLCEEKKKVYYSWFNIVLQWN